MEKRKDNPYLELSNHIHRIKIAYIQLSLNKYSTAVTAVFKEQAKKVLGQDTNSLGEFF